MNTRFLSRMNDSMPIEMIGGKAAGLFRLHSLGLSVPRFVVLTTEAYRAACPRDCVPQILPAEIESCLDVVWTELKGVSPLAVRSSAAEEDGAERSYAGQMESYLNVTSRAALSRAVLSCWNSLHNDRAKAYRAIGQGRTSKNTARAAMAVVIQEMISPESSGVLFTVNPVNGRADEMLISSLWGLGEGLVSGALDADNFVLDRLGKIIRRELAEKNQKIVSSETAGTKRIPVKPDLVRSPSIDDLTLQTLCKQGIRIEYEFERPVDIEFALAHGQIKFLQARPVTAFVSAATEVKSSDTTCVWDNSNIVESYPGITLPLTYSFIRRAYRAVYWQFCQVLGLSEKSIREHDTMLSNMLGLLNGRVYYNLLNWYRLVALLPGFRFNKSFMEEMMGLHHSAAPTERSTWTQRYLIDLPSLLRSGLRAIYLQWTLETQIQTFHREFNSAHSRFAVMNIEAMSAQEAIKQYHAMERDILWHWKAPIINDFSAMIFYGLLKKLTVDWDVDPEGSLQNALISRQGNIESTEVAAELWRIAALISEDKVLLGKFINARPEEAFELIKQSKTIHAEIDQYLARYGDRCIAELKLESRSTRDDPTFCAAVMQNYLRMGTLLQRFTNRVESLTPQEAHALLTARLQSKFIWGIPKLWLYRWVLKRAAAAVRNRENQRLARTRAFAIVRRIFRSIGASLQRDGLLDRAQDVFYLRIEELESVFTYPAVEKPNLRDLVRNRKALYTRFHALPALPEHLETADLVGEEQIIESSPYLGTPAKELKGLGACPGVVERPAMVLLDPDPSVRLDGQILVTRQTDPGWVVLFPSISGLVVERGSMLSHSAIVAREMGIPAVVGLANACQAIRSGDVLRLDGAKGTIEILHSGHSQIASTPILKQEVGAFAEEAL